MGWGVTGGKREGGSRGGKKGKGRGGIWYRVKGKGIKRGWGGITERNLFSFTHTSDLFLAKLV